MAEKPSLFELKVAFIGPSNRGKTHIVHKLCNKKRYLPPILPTIGYDSHFTTIKDHRLLLSDFSGNKRFFSTTKSLLHATDVICLCINPNNLEEISKWENYINEYYALHSKEKKPTILYLDTRQKILKQPTVEPITELSQSIGFTLPETTTRFDSDTESDDLSLPADNEIETPDEFIKTDDALKALKEKLLALCDEKLNAHKIEYVTIDSNEIPKPGALIKPPEINSQQLTQYRHKKPNQFFRISDTEKQENDDESASKLKNIQRFLLSYHFKTHGGGKRIYLEQNDDTVIRKKVPAHVLNMLNASEYFSVLNASNRALEKRKTGRSKSTRKIYENIQQGTLNTEKNTNKPNNKNVFFQQKATELLPENLTLEDQLKQFKQHILLKKFKTYSRGTRIKIFAPNTFKVKHKRVPKHVFNMLQAKNVNEILTTAEEALKKKPITRAKSTRLFYEDIRDKKNPFNKQPTLLFNKPEP